MLLAIREHMSGVVAWVIIFAISVVFVLWGVQSYFGMGDDRFAIKVGDTEITFQEYDRSLAANRQAMMQQFGGKMPTYFDVDAYLKEQTISQFLNRAVYENLLEENRYRVPEDQILGAIFEDERFQVKDQFDQELYAADLRSRGISQGAYEKEVEKMLVSGQLARAIRDSAFVSDREIDAYAKLRYQTRKYEVLELLLDGYQKKVGAFSDDELSEYLEANASQYMTEEKVQIEFMEVILKDYMRWVTVEDSELQAEYDNRVASGSYQTEEQRTASHILIKIPYDAEEGVAEEKLKEIQKIAAQAKDARSFVRLAKKHSEDPGSAAKGGSLGVVQRGVMVPEFEEAVFDLKEGEISKPVKTQFGYHLVRLDKLVPSEVQPFAEVKEDLLKEIKKLRAIPNFDEAVETITTAAFENPDSIEAVADSINTRRIRSEWFTQSKGSGISGYDNIRQAAFSEQVLINKENSNPIEIKPDHIVIFRVVGHEPARAKTLEEAKDAVSEVMKREKAIELAIADADAIVASVKEGKALKSLAKKFKGEYAEHDTDRDNREVAFQAIQKAFAMSPPTEENKISVSRVELGNGNVAVVNLVSTKDGDVAQLDDNKKKKMAETLVADRGKFDISVTISHLRRNAQIFVHPDLQTNTPIGVR